MPHRRLTLLPALALASPSVLGLASAPGCASADWGHSDRGHHDAGAGIGGDGGSPADAGAASPHPDGGEQAGEDGAGCYDFRDGDDDGSLDCDDDDCAAAPVCCVGSSSAECCAEALSETLAFDACSGTGADALLACAPGATLFGSPAPELREGALIPNGGDRYDSGLVVASKVEARVEPRQMEVTIAAAESCERCLDSVAVGLSRMAQGLGASTLVDSDLALMVSTATGEVRLLVGGAVSRAAPLEDVRALVGAPELAPLTYRIETTTEGLARVTIPSPTGAVPVFTDVPYAPRGPARVIAWGRSANRGPADPPPARLERIALRESVCDAPASLARGGDPILPDALDAWWISGERALAPSVVGYEDAASGERRARMAFVYQGRIHGAAGIEGGRFRALADPRDPASALIAPGGADWMAGGVGDPALVRAPDGRWQLWFTAIATDGRRSIARADAAMPDQLVFGAPARVLVPDETSQELGWDAPSIATATIAGVSRTFLAARRSRAGASGDETAIVLFELGGSSEAPVPADTTIFDPALGEALEQSGIVRGATGIASDFDADEVAGPALVAYRGVLRLYYAGRRGTRWSIGVMVSEDARHWRPSAERAVLAGAGAGFDALSVSDPSPVIEGGELRLYYTGSDGVRASIGLARHAIPEEASAP